jgi:hypothetical protein
MVAGEKAELLAEAAAGISHVGRVGAKCRM